mmetsp:Transcript_25426/g.71512  ORF Transcript_25426/g.71512 Transcript_25426/m.71512 type:complete len:112 (+) Transcript_25426:395-730(+)
MLTATFNRPKGAFQASHAVSIVSSLPLPDWSLVSLLSGLDPPASWHEQCTGRHPSCLECSSSSDSPCALALSCSASSRPFVDVRLAFAIVNDGHRSRHSGFLIENYVGFFT